MKNSSQKFLLVTSVILSFLVADFSAAAEVKTDSKSQINEAEDPDLKLSIEELRKKYPISLLDKKKKDYKSGQKVDMKDYSEKEVKAAFLNADRNFISRKPLSDIPHIIVDEKFINDVKVVNQLEMELILSSCKLFKSVLYNEPKKYQMLQSFIFSSEKILNYVYRFVSIEIQVCFDTNDDPFGIEDRN